MSLYLEFKKDSYFFINTVNKRELHLIYELKIVIFQNKCKRKLSQYANIYLKESQQRIWVAPEIETEFTFGGLVFNDKIAIK